MTTPVLGNRVFAKISELDPAVDFDNLDEFVFVQNGSTLKINGQQIANSVTTINNLASKGYVDTLVTNIIDSAPTQLNTLHELSAALNNDENFASTITALIGTISNAVSEETARAIAAEDELRSSLGVQIQTVNVDGGEF